MPVVVHTRQAENDTLDLLQAQLVSGVLQCLPSHGRWQSKLDQGFYISISGIVTFKNAANVRDAAKVPADRLPIKRIRLGLHRCRSAVKPTNRRMQPRRRFRRIASNAGRDLYVRKPLITPYGYSVAATKFALFLTTCWALEFAVKKSSKVLNCGWKHVFLASMLSAGIGHQFK